MTLARSNPPALRTIAILWFLAVAAIVVLADTSNLGPVLALVRTVPFGDKVLHFLLMGGLGLSISLAAGEHLIARGYGVARAVRLCASAVLLAVALEELSQHWISVRTVDLGDFAADCAGIFLAAVIARRVLARRAALNYR